MKKILNLFNALALCSLVSGCELICQAGTGTCGMSREQANKLLHPKAYGEYWTKPEMTTKCWRRDWVACGGWSNGQYGAYTPPGSSDAASSVLWEQTRKKLDACMKSKGYEYRYTESQ